MHLFFYFNLEQVRELWFNYENQLEDPSISLSTYFVKKDNNNEGMFSFINQIMSRAYLIFFCSLHPMIPNELKTHLQLMPDTKIRDWFLFEKHTIIRVYGYEEDFFLSPSFLTPRIYALEYIRKRFSSNYEHFAKYHKPIIFKLLYTIGPFSAKSRTTKEIANELLRNMKFR